MNYNTKIRNNIIKKKKSIINYRVISIYKISLYWCIESLRINYNVKVV